MSEQLTQRIAEVLHDHYPLYCNERENCDTGNYVGGWAKHAAEAVVAALQLTPDERWVPIAKDGSRWKPRTYTQAIEALASPCPDDVGDSWKLTHVIHERSHRTPWVEVQP